ncbi:hypothetical protein BFJ69_g5892 [Fusarium oxysporum]|uniref:Uncharacterized protein n=1 Tax=Fusarium oxysporum TaxID=5507 RepID=A0A420NC93_FUSOX|nr:hypothetical protein BFJ69_g5892 [Fusarium oxysporum]
MSRSLSERRMLRPFKSPSSVHERSHRAVPQRNSDPGSTVETVPKNARSEDITNPKSRTRPILDEIVRHKERRIWRFGLFPALICSDLLNLKVNKSKVVGSHRFASKASYRDSCVAALFKWQSEIHDNAGMHSPLPATCCFVSTG